MKSKINPDTAINRIKEEVNKMKPCPFCGCKMSILITPNWGLQWHGDHSDCQCVLESNPSASYGRIESLMDDWNMRTGGKEV